MKPVRTWIVIADGARARILENDGPGRGVKEVPGSAREKAVPPSREIYADAPGRTFDSAGEGRHAMERPTDAQKLLKEAFAGEIADLLTQALHKNRFDRLIIVAPPAALGNLRQALPDAVRKTVKAELGKDLTKTPNDQLANHLAPVLAV